MAAYSRRIVAIKLRVLRKLTELLVRSLWFEAAPARFD